MPETPLEIRLPRQRIERRAMAWWVIRALILWGLILAGLIVAYVLWEPARVWLVAPMIVVGLILLAKLALEPWWRYRVHRWEITDRATYAAHGWIVREWRVAPTSRIQTVDAIRGPIEQLMGLATLRVTTASAYGSIDINGLDHQTAQEAVTRLTAVAELTEGDAT